LKFYKECRLKKTCENKPIPKVLGPRVIWDLSAVERRNNNMPK
jgi:hypothetical protein